MAYTIQNLRFLVRGGLLAALKAATGALLRPLARELTIATDALSLRVGTGTGEYVDLPVLNPVTPSFQFRTKTSSTADSDPGDGFFKWNNATQASATVLFFDLKTSGTGTDLSTFYAALPSAGFIHVVLEEDRTKWQLWKWTAVTSASGYYKFTVTLMASTASLSDNLPVRAAFIPNSAVTQYTDEMARDAIGAALVAGSNITLTVNDAGDTITIASSGGGGGGSWTDVKKTSSTSRTSTTTLADDPALSFACTAGTTYVVKGRIRYSTAGTTPGFKWSPAYSAAFTEIYTQRIQQAVQASIGSGNELTQISTGILNGSVAMAGGVVGLGYVDFETCFTATASGTFSFQWAQNTSNASATVVERGSHLQYSTF